MDARMNLFTDPTAVMNTVNRLNVIIQQPAGDYEPGSSPPPQPTVGGE